MNAQQWFVKKDGKSYGPFTTEQVKQFANAKKLLPDHELGQSQNGPWSLASKAKGLFPSEQPKEDLPGAKIAASAMALTSSVLNQARGLMSREPKEIIAEVTPAKENPLSRFTTDGQDLAITSKMFQRVNELCTAEESILYFAIQSKPIANFSPDVVALTNRRFMIFRPKMLGRMTFFDCLWKDCGNIHVEENIIGSTITFTTTNGQKESIDYLPKSQARNIYRHGQEQEELAIKLRRDMHIEEIQAGADKTVFNQAIGTTNSNGSSNDIPARLTQLKSLLDAGILSKEEYDSKRAALVAQL